MDNIGGLHQVYFLTVEAYNKAIKILRCSLRFHDVLNQWTFLGSSYRSAAVTPPKGDFKTASAGTHLLGQVQKHTAGRHRRVSKLNFKNVLLREGVFLWALWFSFPFRAKNDNIRNSVNRRSEKMEVCHRAKAYISRDISKHRIHR